MWKMNLFNFRLLNLLLVLGLGFSLSLFVSCTDDEGYTIGVWYERSNFDGAARSGAVSFTIEDKGYICTGFNSKNARLRDLWVYDIQGNYWTQLADMPEEAKARNVAVGFAVGSKGYVTTGTAEGTTDILSDTWEYNPSSNTWEQKDDYPGGGRIYAVGFGIGEYGYVGTGDDGNNYQKDFYRFDPQASAGSQWEILHGFGGNKRRGATVFVIDDVAYLCTGIYNGVYQYDFWKFDPSASTPWQKLRDIANTNDDEDYDDDYDNIRRIHAVSFVIDGKGYLVTGTGTNAMRTDYWVYDPATDLWTSEDFTPFEGSTRDYAVSFSTGRRGFVVTGGNGSSRFDDVWELSPYENEY